MRLRALLPAAALTALSFAHPGTTAAAMSGNVTAAILADQDITLNGDAVVTLPPGTHSYTGVVSGQGTLRISGSGTLVLAKDSTFTLPPNRHHEKVAVLGGNHPYAQVTDADPAAVTVDRGAVLQYGTGGGTGLIGAFPYNTPGYQQNQDNIRVDGTLRLSLTRSFNLGIISGNGLVTQPRSIWGTLQICGTNPFSGTVDNGTGTSFASVNCAAALPNARKVLNQGSWIIDTPLDQTIVQRQVFYNRQYGSDINLHSRPGSRVVLTGYYSWSDGGPDTDPTLSDPALNWHPVPHNLNVRGTNIEGADVQWGDGTTRQIFMPGTADTVYINLHAAGARRSRLTLDYNGPVTLGAPIGGGRYHDTLAAPGQGDVVIAGTRGNDVTFAATQYYNGSTTIEANAILRLGGGSTGKDGGLYTKGPQDAIIDNGSLILQNSTTALTLASISGTGSLTQNSHTTTTLGGTIAYTGPTTVAEGTLALHGSTLAHSSGVSLTTAGATLDLRGTSSTSLRSLTAAKGAKLQLAAGGTLTVAGTFVALTGSSTTAGHTAFAISRSPQSITLTSTGSSDPTGSPSAGAANMPAAGPSTTPTAAATGPVARSSSATLFTAVGAAALCAAGALAALLTRRTRSGAGRHSR